MKTGVSVVDAMTHSPVTVMPTKSLEFCAKLMKEKNIGSLIVEQDKKLLGIITEWDVVRKVVADGRDPKFMRAEDIMENKVVTIEPDKDVFEALVTMRNSDIRHLPVVNGSELLGFLTLKDVLKIQPELFDILLEKVEAGISLKGL